MDHQINSYTEITKEDPAPEFKYKGWTAYRLINKDTGKRCSILTIDRWILHETTEWISDKEIQKLVDFYQSKLN